MAKPDKSGDKGRVKTSRDETPLGEENAHMLPCPAIPCTECQGRESPALDWKAFLAAFGLVFFAELGDKTQLTTMMLAAESRSIFSVFTGAALALILTSLLGVLFGQLLVDLIPPRFLHFLAGTGFVTLGLLLMFGKL